VFLLYTGKQENEYFLYKVTPVSSQQFHHLMATVLLTAQATDMTHNEVIYQDLILACKEERNGVQIWEKTAA